MEESVQSLLFLVVSPCSLSFIDRYHCFRGMWIKHAEDEGMMFSQTVFILYTLQSFKTQKTTETGLVG